MDRNDLLQRLRRATEDDVERALDGTYVQFNEPAADLLEFFNRMVDVLFNDDGEA